MADRQKIIESLNGLKEILKLQRDIQGYGAFIGVVEDAAALLKEQDDLIEDAHFKGYCEGYDTRTMEQNEDLI